jgi:2-C-methyl-D-erythritol 2,4-cyclodiphosphate synthase
MLAGVRFDGVPGLAGHSDADVACHALADAILGAAALGDLGTHFPETDPDIAGIAGLELLARAVEKAGEGGFTPDACDLVLLAGKPAFAPHIGEMRANLAAGLGIGLDRVSVKAKRPEGLSLSGEGVACFALAVLRAK